MRREMSLTWIFSLLLIGLGFLLGHFYSDHDGFSQQEKTLSWTAPSLLTETGDDTASLFMDGIAVNHLWKQDEPAEEIRFPARVGALQMDKLISGTEALQHAWRIHGDDAPFDSVFIPYYSGRDEQVTVWIFEIHSTIEARKHLKRINDRITAMHDPDKYGSFYLQDVQVFYLHAYNEKSYYYRKDNNIFWISMITNDPIPLFLRFYEHF